MILLTKILDIIKIFKKISPWHSQAKRNGQDIKQQLH